MFYSSEYYMFSFNINISVIDYHVLSACDVRDCVGKFAPTVVNLNFSFRMFFDKILAFIYPVGLNYILYKLLAYAEYERNF